MVKVVLYLFYGEFIPAANLAERLLNLHTLLISFSMSKSAHITIKLAFCDVFDAIAALVKACIAVITVDYSIIGVVFCAKTNFAISLKKGRLLFLIVLQKFILLHVLNSLL